MGAPREASARRVGDVAPQLVVPDSPELAREIDGDRGGRWNGAARAPLGRAKGRLDRADAEAELLHGDLPLIEPREESRRQHRQLVRPDARRRANRQHAGDEGDRLRTIGDAPSDRLSPEPRGDGDVTLGESILSGAVEDAVEPLRLGEARPSASLLHARMMTERPSARQTRRAATRAVQPKAAAL